MLDLCTKVRREEVQQRERVRGKKIKNDLPL